MLNLIRRWISNNVTRESSATERALVEAQRLDVELLESRLWRVERKVAEQHQGAAEDGDK